MRRLEAYDAKPRQRAIDPFLRALAEDVALVARKCGWLREPRAVKKRIVQQETAVESFPPFETATAPGWHDDFCLRLADQRRRGIAFPQMPLAEERRRIAALAQVMGNGAG